MRAVLIRDGDTEVRGWLTGLDIMPASSDGAFLVALGEVSPHTGIDEMRLAVLWQMVHASRHCGGGRLIEVGCGRGGSGLFIALAKEHAGIKDGLTLIDTFSGIVKSGEMDHHVDGEMNDSSQEAVAALLGERAEVLKGVFPDEFRSGGARYRFAHIDVDTYASALGAFSYLAPRMEHGGVIVMDDYGVNTTPGIKLAVDKLDWPGVRWVFTLTNQAVAVIL